MRFLIFLFLASIATTTIAQTETASGSPLVNFDDYLKLAQEVQLYRADRLVTLDRFNELSADPTVVILDTRSDSAYNAMHVKGALHLNFSDFTQDNLAKLIPNRNTVILIYCNNNFLQDIPLQIEAPYFASKVSRDTYSFNLNDTIIGLKGSKTLTREEVIAKYSVNSENQTDEIVLDSEVEPLKFSETNPLRSEFKPITLALNIPTFINLVGYGYKNIYELGELVSTLDPRITFEGTAVSE